VLSEAIVEEVLRALESTSIVRCAIQQLTGRHRLPTPYASVRLLDPSTGKLGLKSSRMRSDYQ